MCFCQINTTKVVQSCPTNMGQLWTKRDFLATKSYLKFFLPKEYQSVTITVTISVYTWTCWKKLTFDHSFISKHQVFLFENCCLGKKRWSNVMGTFKNLLGWGAETFKDQSKTQTPCNMAVIDTNQWVSMEKLWLFNVAVVLLFNPIR